MMSTKHPYKEAN